MPTKFPILKTVVFPVVMSRCDNCTIMKTECRRIHAFKLWGWRRLLRVPWTARRSIQSILKELHSGYSLEGLMLKPILWPPDAKSQFIGKNLDARKDRGQEKKG